MPIGDATFGLAEGTVPVDGIVLSKFGPDGALLAFEASRERDADIIEVGGVGNNAAMELGHRLGWTAGGCDCTLVVQEVTGIRDVHVAEAVQYVTESIVPPVGRRLPAHF